MKKTFYITTPIYYPSGKLHIGNSYTTIICDIIARYKRAMGMDVFFLTGTDEHGEKIQSIAKSKGLTPLQYLEPVIAEIRQLWKVLNISIDDYIRTTEDRHQVVVQKVYEYFYKNGDIYLGEYKGLYCRPCETFWTENQVKDGKCPDCNRDVQPFSEKAYFFKMSKYADKLKKYILDNPDFITPESIKNEMLNNFLNVGLTDLCVSRSSFDWGVPLTFDDNHIAYVWIDALVNYISALGYLSEDDSLFKKYWNNDENSYIVHFLGKEISRFHVIYWPIMLMALNLPLPNKIFAHGWITNKEGKMSKSKGNLIHPETITSRYGVDSLRYFLAKEISLGKDGLFSPELFIDCINKDVVNDLCNLFRRVAVMINKNYDGIIPNYIDAVDEIDQHFDNVIEKGVKDYFSNMDKFKIDEAIVSVFSFVKEGNKYIELTKPWELNSSDIHLGNVLNRLAKSLRIAAILLEPILIDISAQILTRLGVKDKNNKFCNIFDNNILNGCKVEVGEAILPRLKMAEEVEYLNSNTGK